MPPNPARQAAMAAKREQMANDPALRDAQESASAAVLGSYEKPQAQPITPAAPAPRPMLPNYYEKGGSVDPRTQLSSSYWDRVGRTAATNRAAQPDNTAADAKARSRDEFLAPPGPRDTPVQPSIPAFNKGGMVKHGSSTHVTCKSKG